MARALRDGRSLVLEAPPGAGKTTRVPRALLDDGAAERGEIVVLEPRRLAARLAARRVAEELGEEVGGTVGYRVRFEDRTGPRTRITFVTEGVLTRRLLGDRSLARVGTVLLDEFHERHLQGDIALALLRALQRTSRPDLRIGVMSATLESAPVAAFLEAPVLRSEGRLFDVAVEHLARADDRPLEVQVAAAVRRLVGDGLEGDVLVFLPGALEIRRAGEALAPLARSADLLVLPLHGSLSPAEQDRAIRPAARRKVILSTNVAETSVTIDGVVAVIDSGLARVASHAPWSGLPSLRVAKIARAAAAQRAGRAGRTRPGRCVRLYTQGDLATRPEHETPEIARLDLAETALELTASGAGDLSAFGWFEPPPPAALEAALGLLGRLGAVAPDAGGEGRRGLAVTALGRRMLAFPVHPRQARMIVEAERRGVAADGCALAALVAEREIRAAPRRDARGSSDLLAALDDLDRADRGDPRAAAVERVRRELARIADRRAPAPGDPARHEEALLITVLAGYPDRVGRVRRPQSSTGRAGLEVVLAAGGTAGLAESSVCGGADLVVAIDAEERVEAGGRRTLVRVASEIQADWLLDLFTDQVKDTREVVWDEAAERAVLVARLSYDALVLEESRSTRPEPEAASRVLLDAARRRGPRAFAAGDLDRLAARVAFARAHCPEAALPALDDVTLDAALAALCEGRSSFAELREAGLDAAILDAMPPSARRDLEEIAPERVTLPGGRGARIEYPPDGGPTVASRLQDFFGMAEGPRVARGRVPLVLHLLAPNQRAVQVTTDLAGFWTRHYPAIARELRRRYPKHAWPDDPRTARPPQASRR